MSRQDQLHSYLEAGLRAHTSGDIESAKAAYENALGVAPENADAYHLLGVAELQIGRIEQAIDYLQRATRKLRDDPAVVGNLAQAYFAAGRFEESRNAFRNASRLDPRKVQFQAGIANSHAMQGNLDEAERLLRQLSGRFPQSALVWFNLGNVLRDRNRGLEATESYRSALKLDANLLDARNNLGEVLHKLLRFEDAEREYRACIATAPDYLLAHCNLASVLMDLGRFEEAEILCREVLKRAPDWGLIHTFLGAALGHQGRVLEAVKYHRVAAELAPDDAKVAQNLASALADSGTASEALRWFNRALALDSQLASTHLLRGYTLLGHACLAEGWAEYCYRPWPNSFREKYPQIALSQTLPADLSGKHICVMREQGLGDEIFFLRIVPQLHAAGARITYCASDKIGSLLKRVPGIAEVLAEAAPPLADADAVILAGDLPHAVSNLPTSSLPVMPATDLNSQLPNFCRHISVIWPRVAPPLALSALSARVAEMRENLRKFGPPPYVGLTWRAGTPPREQRMVIWALYKEIAISALGAVLRDVPGTFVALQRNPAPGEIEKISAECGRPVHDLTGANEDLESMLALLSVLDEYIAVSNTNVHLRAGLGMTAHVLVPCPPDWRWMYSGRESIWFPGFAIYRQSPRGDWDGALDMLRQNLAKTRF